MHIVSPHQTKVLPNEVEILQWILHVRTHAFNTEYFLQRFQFGSEDPDRPHDIVHPYNKFEWEAVKGFALQYRKDGRKLYHPQIMASREYHRHQYHHQKWNQLYPDATEDAMKLGAVDAVCSLLEDREYQDGIHTYEQIEEIASKNPIHKIGWMKYAISEMKRIKQPNLAEITSFSKIPREGITPETYDIITGRTHQTLRQLEQDHGYNFYHNSERYIIDVLK